MKKIIAGARSLVCRAFNGALGSSKNLRPVTTTAVAVIAPASIGILVFAASLLVPPTIRADDDTSRRSAPGNGDDGFTTFTVDVAQEPDGYKQVDVDPSEGQLVFSRGDVFLLKGNIYPKGTLRGGPATNDPSVPGIGKYMQRGTCTIDSVDFERAKAHDPGAPSILAFVTEIFSLPDDGSTIMTDGVWPNAYFSTRRVVLGGTGRFAGVVGEIYEQNIGENATGFCNMRVTFKIRKASARRDH